MLCGVRRSVWRLQLLHRHGAKQRVIWVLRSCQSKRLATKKGSSMLCKVLYRHRRHKKR